MGKAHIEHSIVVKAPIEKAFAKVTDHEAMGDWPGISSCAVITEGTPRNGLGAVRRVKAGGLTLDEEIVQFEPPNRYDYVIIRGLPVTHRGTVTLTEEPSGVRVRWSVSIASRVPGIAELVGFALGRGLPGGLRAFAKSVE